MRALTAFFLLLFTVTANAQQAQQTERIYTLTISATQLNLIARTLRKLPYDEVVLLLESLAQQADAQNKVLNKPPEEKPQ